MRTPHVRLRADCHQVESCVIMLKADERAHVAPGEQHPVLTGFANLTCIKLSEISIRFCGPKASLSIHLMRDLFMY